jgi:hypothetical protein
MDTAAAFWGGTFFHKLEPIHTQPPNLEAHRIPQVLIDVGTIKGGNGNVQNSIQHLKNICS